MSGPVDVFNQSLAVLGENPISSFQDATEEARIAAARYETVVRNWLTRHDWTWARTQRELGSPLSLPPLDGWQRAYAIPPETVALLALTLPGGLPFDDFALQSDKILTDHDTNGAMLTAEIVIRPHERDWPASFTNALVEALKAEIRAADNPSEAAGYQERAARLMRDAANRAHRQEPARPIAPSERIPLVAARRGGRLRRDWPRGFHG